ncbi:hypothetical protein KAT08_00345 [Candidatus Babeliales bacterium]|nr:hypothetical protein [Candidatus Babeliales bacterium]
MWGKFRDFLTFVFFICFLFFTSFIVSDKLIGRTDPKILDLKSKKDSKDFSKLIEKNLRNLKDLDYYESEGLSIILPGNKVFKVCWHDKGSGNILSPFESVKAVIEDLDGKTDINDSKKKDPDKFSLEDFAKLFIKTKIKKSLQSFYGDYKQMFGSWGWLIKNELSSVEVFAIKLVLLMIHDFGDKEINRKIEILRLLFRLSQSKVFNLLDKKSSVFSYLPKDLSEKLKINISEEWQEFIDKMWKGLTEGLNNHNFDKDGQFDKNSFGVMACGFVFDESLEALECFEKLSNKKNYTEIDFQDEVEKNVSWHYNTYKNFKDFGRISSNTELDFIPEKIKKEILSVIDFPKVKLINVSDTQSWIIYVSDKLSLFETINLLFSVLIKGFEEYKEIKKENDGFMQENENEFKNSEEMEKILRRIEQLEKKKNDLKISFYYAGEKAQKTFFELEEKEKKAGSYKSKLSMALIKKAKEKYKKDVENRDKLKNKLEIVEKEIYKLKSTPEYFLSDYDVKHLEKNGIWGLVIDSFVNSPELKRVLSDINCAEKYKIVKSNLYKRIVYIFKKSQNVKENFELWNYILTSIFPDLTSLMEDLKVEWKDNGFYDEILNSVFGL